MAAPIHSGSSHQRMMRVMSLTVMVIGFAATFLLDGYRGYPHRNLQELGKHLGLSSTEVLPIEIRPELTAAKAKELIDIIGQERPRDASALTGLLGQPSYFRGQEFYYVGEAGWLRVDWHSTDGARAEWVGAGKSETDIAWQKWIGFGLLVIGWALLVHLLRVVFFRASLTEAGLKIGRRPFIPLDAITSIRADNFQKTGRVEIRASVEGREIVVATDDYEVKELKSLVAAICNARGFENPLEQKPAVSLSN